MTLSIFFLKALIFLGFCGNTKDAPPVFIYPDELWVVSKPEQQGVNSRQMFEALDLLKKSCGVDGLEETVIIRNGFMIYEGDSVYKKHDIFACSKAITGTVLGLLVGEYKCSLNDYAADLDTILEANYNTVRLRHFATMTSGYSAVGTSRWCAGCSQDGSRTPYRPANPLFLPGNAFCDWDESHMMLGRVLTKLTKEDMKTYLDDRIMKPIGITKWEWLIEDSLYTTPIRNGCSGISMNALQLARFGHLFLSGGNWRGDQLIPEQWVIDATQIQVPESMTIANTDRKAFEGNGRYGYNWWLRGSTGDMPDTPPNTFYMSGINNNMCFVIPEWNMVVVRLGLDGNPTEDKRILYNQFFRELGKAIM